MFIYTHPYHAVNVPADYQRQSTGLGFLQDHPDVAVATLAHAAYTGWGLWVDPGPSPLQQPPPSCDPELHQPKHIPCQIFSKADFVELESLPCQVSVPVLSHLLLLLLELPCMDKNDSL